MEVVTPQQHRVLAFVSACIGSGYAPTVGEINAWIESPEPTSARYGGPPWTAIFANVYAVANLFQGPLEASAESPVDHLIRIGWLTLDSGVLRLSPIGQALYAAADRSDVTQSGPTVVMLGRDDPLAYPTLFSELMKAGAGLLIDPYVRVEQLHLIVTQTQLARILIKKCSDSDLSAIEVYLTAHLPRPIEVRLTSDPRVHDRLILWGDGSTAQTMGASVNTVERGTGTVVSQLPDAVASAMHAEAEAWWTAATPMPRMPSPPASKAVKRKTPAARPKTPGARP